MVGVGVNIRVYAKGLLPPFPQTPGDMVDRLKLFNRLHIEH